MDAKSLAMDLLRKEQSLKDDLSILTKRLEAKEQILKQQENRLRQGLLQNDDVKNMKANLSSSLPSYLAPGNVGDMNRVIWPFFFSTSNNLPIAPNTNIRTTYSVTQEAGFVWMVHMKAVYSYDSVTGATAYINPDDPLTGSPGGLTFNINDAQSGRSFFNTPVNIDTVGNPRWPSALPSPMLVIPNGVMEVNFQNSDPTNYYIPIMTFFGYRLRMENAQEMLSTVYG